MKCGRAETANRNALVLENYVLLKEFSEKRSSLTARGPSAVWVWPRAYFQEEEAEVSVLKTPRYLEFSGREANAKFLIDVLPTMKLNNEWIAIQHTAKHSNFPHTLIPKLNSQLLQMSNYPDRDSKTTQNSEPWTAFTCYSPLLRKDFFIGAAVQRGPWSPHSWGF